MHNFFIIFIQYLYYITCYIFLTFHKNPYILFSMCPTTYEWSEWINIYWKKKARAFTFYTRDIYGFGLYLAYLQSISRLDSIWLHLIMYNLKVALICTVMIIVWNNAFFNGKNENMKYEMCKLWDRSTSSMAHLAMIRSSSQRLNEMNKRFADSHVNLKRHYVSTT